MFTFFHRTSTIHVDSFTFLPDVYRLTPVVNSYKSKPDWFLKLPPLDKENQQAFLNTKKEVKNIRTCYGFLEFFNKGVVIENWCDIGVRTEGNGDLFYRVSSGPVPELHNPVQYNKGFTDYHNIKLISPWKFKSKEKVKFLMVGSEWNLDKFNIKILPGVLDLDITSGTNIFLMTPKAPQKYIIPVGNPLVHIIPLSEKKMKITNHLVTYEEFEKFTSTSRITYLGWRKVKKLLIKKDSREKQTKKCPFGFGD